MQGAVLEPASYVDKDVATWEPSLAGAVDVRIGDVPEAHVAADVYVPRAEVRVDVVVVTMRLERHSERAPEVGSASDRASRGSIEHADVDPVPPSVGQLYPSRAPHDRLSGLQLTPAQLPHLLVVRAELECRRWERGNLYVGAVVAAATPTRDCPFVFFGEGLYVCRYAAVDLDDQVRLVAIHRDHHRLPGHTHKGVLVGSAEGNGAHGEGLPSWDHLDPGNG